MTPPSLAQIEDIQGQALPRDLSLVCRLAGGSPGSGGLRVCVPRQPSAHRINVSAVDSRPSPDSGGGPDSIGQLFLEVWGGDGGASGKGLGRRGLVGLARIDCASAGLDRPAAEPAGGDAGICRVVLSGRFMVHDPIRGRDAAMVRLHSTLTHACTCTHAHMQGSKWAQTRTLTKSLQNQQHNKRKKHAFLRSTDISLKDSPQRLR